MVSLPDAQTHAPSVPPLVEDVAAMRARLPAALARDWDASLCAAGGPRPGEDPACVFDFPDGLRLIVSFDRPGPHIDARLHVSAGYDPRGSFAIVVALVEAVPRLRAAAVVARMTEAFTAISLRKPRWRECYISERGVVHLFGPTRRGWEAGAGKHTAEGG